MCHDQRDRIHEMQGDGTVRLKRKMCVWSDLVLVLILVLVLVLALVLVLVLVRPCAGLASGRWRD